MRIFVLNRGSSSIKCYLYEFREFPHEPIPPIWTAHLQWKNDFSDAHLKIAEKDIHTEQKSPKEALEYLLGFLPQGKIDAVGHRVVHGGKFFKEKVTIDESVKQKIRALAELAPLHNVPQLEGIEILQHAFVKTPQIAVFDTAFHRSIPDAAKIYPGPYRWYEEGIERYGFHGISYQYCAKRAAEILKERPKKMLICHLGSGASLCAVLEGKSVDTTMGFTPLDGLMMDTRPGAIDPGILLYLLEKKHKSASEISHILYHESGLLGLSGISSDMRDILESAQPRAKLALDVYVHRLNAQIGSMIASLKGLDVLIFTAGIGENAPLIREKVCQAFAFCGVELDAKKNAEKSRRDCVLSTSQSKVKVVLIHTQEAFEIARECWNLINKE